MLLGDIGNRLDIEDTERDIAQLKRKIAGTCQKDMSQDQKIDALVAENAELKLYVASIARLLTVKGTILEDELRLMVEAVDAEDGISDGKFDGDLA